MDWGRVAVLSFCTSFVLAAVFTFGIGLNGHIDYLCAERSLAFPARFTVQAALASEVLAKFIRKVVFTGILVDLQLLLIPVPLERLPEWKFVAATVPEVNEEPQHDPARPGNPSNAMGEHDEKENTADAQEPEHTCYGQQACLAIFASKSDIEGYFEGAGGPRVFEAQREQRNEHQHVGSCSAKGIHVGQDIIDIG